MKVNRLTAGRVASGERWLFDRYFSRTRVWRGNRLLLHDAVHQRTEAIASELFGAQPAAAEEAS